jgi:hypothetical protein
MIKAISTSPIIEQNYFVSEWSIEKLTELFNHGFDNTNVIDISTRTATPDDSIIDDCPFISARAALDIFFDKESETTICDSAAYAYAGDLEEIALPLPLHVHPMVDARQSFKTKRGGIEGAIKRIPEPWELDAGSVSGSALGWQLAPRLLGISAAAGIAALVAGGIVQLATQYRKGTVEINSAATAMRLFNPPGSASAKTNMLAEDVSHPLPLQQTRETHNPDQKKAMASFPNRESGADAEMLVERGKRAFSSGDITSARLILKRVAESGDVMAAFELGRTYDPAFLAGRHIVGNVGNPAEADRWYERGFKLAVAGAIAEGLE